MTATQLMGGPHDGLVVNPPQGCRELRFPVPFDPGYLTQFRSEGIDLTQLTMRVSVYQLCSDLRFYYRGEQ